MNNQEIAWLLKEKYNGQKTEGFLADCARLEAGEPLAYIIGSIPFLNCTITLTSKPLIPRPETEFWVEQAIAAIKLVPTSPRQGLGETWANVRVLDLCAGSGAIGVAVAKAIPEVRVSLTELDATHRPTIRQNLTQNLPFEWKVLGERYTFYTGDLFAAVPPDTTFDFILSNPPYIDAEANTVDANVTANEPHLALFGGCRGLELIERIITAAPAYLNPGGQLWLEHEPFQAKDIATLAHQQRFSATHHNDQYGTVRYSILTYLVAE